MLKAKLSIPRVHKNTISRQKVLEKLARIPEYRVTSIVAPVGYGKTTAALDYLAKCGLPAAWLSLDANDNNPATFWRYVMAALEGVAPGVGRDAEYVFSSRELLDADAHVSILIDRLDSVEADFIAVFDDLHLIDDPAALRGLAYLIEYMPPSMHLVLTSRTEPELRLTRRFLAGQILRLDEKDLRFSNQEISGFYRARGFALAGDEIKQVESYTEGWAAALVAVAMSMERARGGTDVIAGLARASRDIGEYLKGEVIASWRPEKLAFAMKTSILHTLTAPLCDAVTGAGNARRLLREISRDNGFLAALDEEGREYRYHHLFSHFLRNLLADVAPEEISGLHARAARWYGEQGNVSEAIEHLLCGGAYEEALAQIERRTDYLIHQNEFNTLRGWLERLPAEMIERSFQAAFLYTTYYAALGRFELSRQWLEKARERAAGPLYANDPEWSKHISIECALSEANLMIREGNEDALAMVVKAAALNDDGRFAMPEYFDINTADIYCIRCPFGKSVELFGKDRGRFEAAMGRYRELISVNPGYTPLEAGECLYESNRLEEALPYLFKALEEARAAGCAGALVPAMVCLARLRRAKGDMAGAYEALDECESELRAIGKPHWNYLISAFRCRLDIECGAAERVEAWFASRKLDVYSKISPVNEFELIVYARALGFKGRADGAKLLLERLLAYARDAGRPHSTVEVMNLLAMRAAEGNDMRSAMDHLGRSLEIGREKGYCRSFIDEGTPMAGLLGYLGARRPARRRLEGGGEIADYARQLLSGMRGDAPAAHAHGVEQAAGEIDRLLTRQEKKIAELLAAARTNEEIGRMLGISVRTVKTHTGNIYAKLGVKSRAQCAKLIRESRGE